MSDYDLQSPSYLVPVFAEHMLSLVNPLGQRAKEITEEARRAESARLLQSSLASENCYEACYALPRFNDNLRDFIQIGIRRTTEVIQELISNESIKDLQTYNDSYKPILTFVENIARLPGSTDALFTNRNRRIILDQEVNPPVVRFLDESLNRSLDDEISRNPGRGCFALKIKDDDGISMFESIFRIVFETIKMHLFASPVNQEPALQAP